ncbi:MAG: glycosyltransferase, partial [Chloroflexota bacterium]
MTLKIYQLDAAAMTPYYDIALCRALARAGGEVRYITSPFLYDSDLPLPREYHTDLLYFARLDRPSLIRYPILRRLLRALLYRFGHLRLLRQIDSDPPDVVHIQWSRFPLLDRWLLTQIQQRDIPIVHTVHDVIPLFAHAQSTSLSAVYERADRLIVHAASNRDALLSLYPALAAERVRIIPHILPYHPLPGGSQAQARRTLGIPSGVPVLLFFGSIRPYK